MKSISPLKLSIAGLILLLGGCSSPLVEQVEQVSNQTADAKAGPAQEQLTAYQIMALDLKQQPNQFVRTQGKVSESVKTQFRQALKLKEQNELQQAEQAFRSIASQQVGLSGPHLQLGDLALLETDKARFERAEQHYQIAVEINPHNYHARNRLARVLREQGKFAEAEEQYKQALVSWPAFKPSYLNLGILYDLYLGDKAKALEHYQIYQALNDKPERKVKGWIADLSRQVNSQKTSQLAEAK